MLTIPLPHDGLWTLDAYHALPEDLPATVDLVDGILRVHPRPAMLHQTIGRRLANAIEANAPETYGLAMEVDVLLRGGEEPTEVVPDVVAISTDHDPTVRPIPASSIVLAVEVVSPGSKRKDRVDFPRRYAEAGIRHYWRVETPLSSGGLQVFTYRLEDGIYVPTGEFAAELNVDEPFPMSFDVPSLAD